MPLSKSILAGPILRRSTKNRICVWLALTQELDITLEILDANSPNRIGLSNPMDMEQCRFQLGKNLYIYLLQAYPLVPDTFFPFGQVLSYRFLDVTGQELLDFKAAGLVYANYAYPHFHIAEQLGSILHGSCRKPHGAKGEDCMLAGDAILEAAHATGTLGPDLLLLTGDQIYADDVDTSLLYLLKSQAPNLLGYSEAMPGAAETELTPVLPETIPLAGRANLIKQAGFSSSEAANHLMGFGEFAAMYIYVFGNAPQWPLATWATVKASQAFTTEQEAVLEQSALAVAEFNKTLGRIRRLMANIPTYMIFDDHDVTDDWNITGHWYDKVRTSPLGQRIVANALAAYWAFQGWGNDPENFDTDMIKAIINFTNQSAPSPEVNELYDLTTWKHRGWSYSIPTQPPIIAMDSRTQRQPDNAYYPPRLLDRYALDWLRLEWSKLNYRHQNQAGLYPVLIATTPVIGFSPIEKLTQMALWLVSTLEDKPLVKWLENVFGYKSILTETIVNNFDAEAWSSNFDGFTDLQNTLLHKMQLDKCLFLSGDVHYAFSTTGFYRSNGYNGLPKQLGCCQLTSSSLRNEPEGKQKEALTYLSQHDHAKTKITNWWNFSNRWQLEHELIHASNGNRVLEDCNLGQVEFKDGLPVAHKLWTGATTSIDFQIPHF
ncbi:MAG: hypothetical protein WC782_16685 [Methylococcaceae bacterium]